MERKLEKISLTLEKDILNFSNTFTKFKLIFDTELDTLKESVLSQKLSNEAKSLLLDLKNCQIRVNKDTQKINKLLNNLTYILTKKEWFNTNRNLIDFLDTCNNVFEEYNIFLRKDIKILKVTFEKLSDSVKTLNEKIKEYNKNVDLKFVEITNRFNLLNKVINFGYKITNLEKNIF